MMQDNLFDIARQTIKEYNMISPGDCVVVGVSGGADSMALLHLLVQLRDELDFSLTVAHVNHGLRGEESHRDQAFVEKMCRAWGVALRVQQADILTLSRQAGQGAEEFARNYRYDFFRSLAQENGGKIATAHTADDNAETVLLNLVRGTGVTGLSGIPPVRKNIIRPLIGCSRQMVEGYCRQHQIPYVTDSTNLQDDYRRNRIRHHVIPALKEENSSFLQAVTRMTQANRRDSEFLLSLGKTLLDQSRRDEGYDLGVLQAAEEVPLTYAVKVLLQKESLSESAHHLQRIKALIHKGHGSCSLSGSRTARASGGLLCVMADTQTLLDFTRYIPLKNGVYYAQGKRIALTVTENQNVHNFLTYNLLDCDTIGTQLVLRNRRPGDKITLPGRCTKSLKKLFIEEKIPLWERSRRLILADETGVLWVEGVGCDARCTPSRSTTRLLCIQHTESTTSTE